MNEFQLKVALLEKGQELLQWQLNSKIDELDHFKLVQKGEQLYQ